jgi:hypothetical protein
MSEILRNEDRYNLLKLGNKKFVSYPFGKC